MQRLTTIALLAALVGCSSNGTLKDPQFATGSSTLVADAAHARVYTVNTDAGTITSALPDGTDLREITVGSEPTRVARAGNRLYVTLRGERSVAVVDLASGEKIDSLELGAEPFGVVASEDGSKVYVSVSQDHRVVELDGASGAELRSFHVPREPRFLALHPNGTDLFVASSQGEGRLYHLDVSSRASSTEVGELPDVVELPTITRFDESGFPVEITARLTGDMSISFDGTNLAVPVTYVDNITPVDDPELDGDMPIAPISDGYGGGGGGISRFNPGVVVVPVPGGEPDADGVVPVFIGGESFSQDGNFGPGFPDGFASVRSYPTSATFSPEGTAYLVTFEGSGAVAIVGVLPFENTNVMIDFGGTDAMPPFEGEGSFLPFTSLDEAGFLTRPKVFSVFDGYPTGALFLDGSTPVVHAQTDRALLTIPFNDMMGTLTESGKEGFDFGTGFRAQKSPELAPQVLPNDIYEGRKLFYSATNTSMASIGGGVSCAACHTDGRNDGLTWNFEIGARQTPSLAGQVSQTAPVTWTSNVESVSHEARITTQARMGGGGLETYELNRLAAYIDWTRLTDVPELDASAAARGQAIFERADVGCASCHSGEAFTDNSSYTMFGLTAVNTPTLRGIAGSAPYLHNGTAGTLRDVLEFSRSGEMGNTSSLSASEMDDLEAYLKSL